MPLITETYYLSLTQDNRGILRLRCSQDDTLRTVNLKLYNNGSIFVIPSGISASISGVKQNGAVFSKPCTISQNRESVVLQLSSDITNVDGIIVAEIVLNDGEGGRLGTSNFIIQVEKNPIRAGVVQDTETPIEYINDFIEKIQTLTARLNNLITPSGDPSLAEVVDARIGILDSTTYQTLGARLNAEFQRLSNALNGTAILESTGDTTDRTSEILSKLNTYGVCKLGKGDFYVNSLVMPEDSQLIGSGKSTRIILPSSVTDGYVVKPKSNCIIENISFYGGFTGTHSELIASAATATRHCIILDRFNNISSENVILNNIFINNFVGSAIIQRYTTGCHCEDIIINMCYVGIDISNASYDGQCTNISMTNTRFGVVQNGSNFVFTNCVSKDSDQHILSDQQNTECTFSSCTFSDSSLETTSRLATLSNVRNGFVFDNCIFDSSLKMLLNACDGIVIKGTNFVGSDTFRIIVSNGRNTLLLITDCIADVEPVVTNAGTAARITSCYLKDGTAWSISEAQDGSGGSSTLAELTDIYISSEQDGQVLTYDGTSHKWVNRTPSDGSVEIEVDNELSSTSENPVQNKVINRKISEIKADLGEVTANLTLQTSKNHSVSDESWTQGYYKGNGAANSTVANSAYAYSANIPVTPGDTVRLYALYNSAFGLREMYTICAYDADGNFILKPDSVSWRKTSYVVQDDTAYIIISTRISTKYMVTFNEEVTEYEPYITPGYVAKTDFLPNGIFNDISTSGLKNQYACALPKRKLRQTVGLNEKWYKKSMITPETDLICVNAGYNLTTAEADGFVISNASASAGNNGYVWYAYDILFNQIFNFDYGTGWGAPMVRQAENLSGCSLLAIGDSTIDHDHITGKLLSYFTEKGKTITLLGTLGKSTEPLNKNEGRAGWTTADYMGNTTKNGYTNPFYNPSTEGFDFSYYMSQQGYASVDFVVIQLGINDLYPSQPRIPAEPDYATIFANIKTMIDSILLFNSSAKIIVNLPMTPNSDPSAHRIPEFLYRHYVIRFNEIALAGLMAYSENNVRVSYCHLLLDPATDISDNVHPTVAGYEKMALEIVNQINCWQNGV